MIFIEHFLLIFGAGLFGALLPEFLGILGTRPVAIPAGQNIASGLAAICIAGWYVIGA